MIAADANVVVRLLVADDPDQHARARALFAEHAVYLPITVVLETAWVLRSAYGHDPATVCDALLAVVGLPGVTCAEERAVLRALDDARAGLDVADALHRALSEGCDALATFDQGFQRAALDRGGHVPVRAP